MQRAMTLNRRQLEMGLNSTCDGEQDHSSQFGVTWGLDTSDEAGEDDGGKTGESEEDAPPSS